MIRVRELFERHLQRRRLAAVLAVLVVLLALLVSVHPISDEVVEHAAVVCAAAVLVLGVSLIFFAQERIPAARASVRGRNLLPRAASSRTAFIHVEDRSLPLLR